MNSAIRYVIIGLVILVFLSAMATYTVRFNETAVVTTFGEANEQSVVKQEGLGFVWPYVQRVTKYDRRLRYIETVPETVQTQEKRQLIITAGAAWRVSDPLKFYKATSGRGSSAKEHYAFGEELIKGRLRAAMAQVAQYRVDQMIASSLQSSRLSELEARMLDALKASNNVAIPSTSTLPGHSASPSQEVSQSLAEYGIEPVSVGIVSIALPQDTTKEVFKGMNQTRKTIGNEAISQGKSEASSIRSRADAQAQKITDFAKRLAEQIKAQGELESQQYVRQMSADADLAVFIKQMQFMESAFSENNTTTLVLPTSLPGMEWFMPDALKKINSKGLSGSGNRTSQMPSGERTAAADTRSESSGSQISSENKQ